MNDRQQLESDHREADDQGPAHRSHKQILLGEKEGEENDPDARLVKEWDRPWTWPGYGGHWEEDGREEAHETKRQQEKRILKQVLCILV